ncbi:glycoside hydrolase family 25 protein [Mucilaginibacter mali]|uniref:Glycoside hydrolase family 25 protein n=1 Tax=Mucilaginibacter mali TaxID=2740462 RepID=A0A7D4Q807_9SPHI|nr:GH25 family lysozyme [Mucilaginibacter mali]QKJ29425.1 glycoside hydrolase family 25 protein [Mucilaginibacter mali]
MAAQKRTSVTKSKTTPKKKAPAKRKSSGGIKTPWKLIIGLLLILLSPFYYGYVVKAFTSTWQWIKDIGEDPHYRTYKSFNIRIPNKYHIHGIDVSYAQGKIDWQRVKNMEEDSVRISFAFIKATEGLITVDPYFKRNWREAPKMGIVCGAYHFFHPEKNGVWQARFFLQNVTVEKGDLPPVADVEKLYGVKPEVMRKELKAYLGHIYAQTGVRPIIYTGLSFYADYLAGYFDEYKLWIANYHQPHLQIAEKSNWQFWQHSDIARINGIGHTVDFDAFRGDSLAFQKMLVH